MATKNFIEELEWRGMIHTIMPGAKEQLEKEMTTAYLGIVLTKSRCNVYHAGTVCQGNIICTCHEVCFLVLFLADLNCAVK